MDHLEQRNSSTMSTFYWFNWSIVLFGLSIWIILVSSLSTFFPIAAVFLFVIGGAASLVMWLRHIKTWIQFQRKPVYVEGTVLKCFAELQSGDADFDGETYKYYVVVEFLNGTELVRLKGRVKASYYQGIHVGSDVDVRFAPGHPAFAQFKWDDRYRSVVSSGANDMDREVYKRVILKALIAKATGEGSRRQPCDMVNMADLKCRVKEEGVVLTCEKIGVTLRQKLGFETDFLGEETWVKTGGWAGLVTATAKIGYED